MEIVDHRRPQAASHRDGTRLYQPGIGPFGEDDAVAMAVAQMQTADASVYAVAGKRRYPGGSQVCDLAIGAVPDWAIEVKLARLGRDNGTYEDAAIKKILSPYPEDRSAVTDCAKLARSSFAGRCAILIYGFEDPQRPLHWLIEAFEAVTSRITPLGPREEAPSVGWCIPCSQQGTFALGDSQGPALARGRGRQPRAIRPQVNHRVQHPGAAATASSADRTRP